MNAGPYGAPGIGGVPAVNKWIVAITVMLPTLIEIIDTSVANVALDHIRGSLSAGIDESAWVLTSYLVSNAIVIPMTGFLARTFGRKRYLLFSVALFTVASFLCGAATSLGMLVAFRVLQGIGGGALQPLSQAILLETFPPREHGMAMALFGVGVMFGPIAGPLMGGYITDLLSWRWIFYVNIPIGLLAMGMIGTFIHDPPYLSAAGRPKIDKIGIALLVVWVGALQILLDKGQREDWFQSDLIMILGAVSLVGFVAFIVWEVFATEHPVVDLRAFLNRSFLTGNLMMFVSFLNLMGSIVLLPLFAQILLGYTATLAGLVLSPGGVATLLVMPFVGRFISKGNPKLLLFPGVLVCAFSTWEMSHLSLGADFAALMGPRIWLGVGMGLLFIPLTTLTLSSVPREQMGNATSIYNFLRNLGGSIGVAISTTIFTSRAQLHQSRLVENLTPLDPAFNAAREKATALLTVQGVPPEVAGNAATGAIYGQVVKQATAMGFADAFLLMAILMAAIAPLVFILKRPRHAPADPAVTAH